MLYLGLTLFFILMVVVAWIHYKVHEINYVFKLFVVRSASPLHDRKLYFYFPKQFPKPCCIHAMKLYGDDYGLTSGFWSTYTIPTGFTKVSNINHTAGNIHIDMSKKLGEADLQWWKHQATHDFKRRNLKKALGTYASADRVLLFE